MRRALGFVLVLALAGCAAQQPAPKPIAEFLAFGDGGYHYAYLDADEGSGVATLR